MAITREHLRDYLLHVDERAVYHAYPRHMADNLRTDHRTMLALLTEAMLDGEASLHWEVQCPACHHEGEVDSLGETTGELQCSNCGGRFAAHVDDEIHVTFSPHPALRALSTAAGDPEYRQTILQTHRPTTGHDLLTVQAFRDWAQAQPLPSGESLEVRHVTLWFSDLSGSTALYARRGDPQAFQLVRGHFDVLFAAIDQAGGVVVKTIGDSVMAAFIVAENALRGAIACHTGLAEFNDQNSLSGDDRLMLKVGIHSGPSIMVTLNERLDYFGQTVNLASRISDLAGAGGIALSQAAFDAPGVESLLTAYPVEARKASVKGVDEPVVVNRFSVPV
jgi:class 3 adenylate cyclase